MDFLKARFEVPSEIIFLGGESHEIPRQGLGGHYALESLNSKIKEFMDRGLYATVDLMMEWLYQATGFNEFWLDKQDPVELADVFSILVELNAPRGVLPWMTHKSPESKTKSSIDYPNRSLVGIVDMIASEYHWDEEYILNLPPEAVWCYVQEILLSRHKKREFEYSLSDVAYDKKGQYKDYQKLPWDRSIETGARIPKSMEPKGNVVTPE